MNKMEFAKIIERAKEIRKLYAEFEKKEFGREWTREQIFQGLIADIGDLSKLIVTEGGAWPRHAGKNRAELKRKIAHELSDCLWSIIVLADKYDIDLEGAFIKAMGKIREKISR